MADYKISGARLTDIANAIRGKTGSTDPLYLYEMATAIDDIVVGGGAAPDGMEVTFGYEDGAPAEREEAYTILSTFLNELGAIVQSVAGKSDLMSIDEMLYHLNRAKFIPQGYASSVIDMNTLSFESSAVGELQEG